MAVYVDNPIWQRHHGLSGHMIADTQQELAEMAEQLAVNPNCYMLDALTPHIQLPAGLRDAALGAGAIALERDAFLAKAKVCSEAHFRARQRQAACKQKTKPSERIVQALPLQQDLL